MSFGFGISDFEYVIRLGQRLRNFVKSIKDAPKDFDALRAEAECLEVCLHVVEYNETASILANVTDEQAEDLRVIIRGCRVNMTELTKFIVQCQRITVDSTGGKDPRVSLWDWFKAQGKRLWSKMEFVNTDKQPMRDKLAIPTQSLNIYLVSLTYISLSYNTRLSYGPTGPIHVPPAWSESWAVVGSKVAFKRADFTLTDLRRPGVEDAIIDCAKRKIAAGAGGGRSKKPAPGVGGIKVPKRPRRKSSIGPRAVNTDPDGMFLVRPLDRARSKSRRRASQNIGTTLSPSVEIVKADYSFESDSGSDSIGLDGEPISPRRGPSPPTHSSRGGDDNYEARSPRAHSPSPPPADNYYFDGRGRDRDRDHDRDTERPHYGRVEWQNTLRDLRRRLNTSVQEEIVEDRIEGIEEMTEGYVEEIRSSDDPRRSRYSAEPELPDIRAFMEATYGVIVNPVSPEVESINLTRTRFSPTAGRSRTSEKLKEESRHSRRTFFEDEGDSDIEEPTEIMPQASARLSQASRTHNSDKYKTRTSETIEITSFAIPRTEYIPRTESAVPGPTSVEDRYREQSLRQREASLREREASLREREIALAMREERERRRKHSPETRARVFKPDDFEESVRDAEIIQTLRPQRPQFRSEGDSIRLAPGEPRHPSRRAASYSGPSEEIHRDRYSSEEDSMYGPIRPNPRAQDRIVPSERERTRRSRKASSSEEEGGDMYVVRRKK